jgi:hypothetical protein
MRSLGTVIRILLGVMEGSGQRMTSRGRVAAELVGHQPSRLFPLACQNLAEESLGSGRIATPLHEYIEHIAVLINGSPQIVLLSAYFDEHLVDIPCIAEPTLASFQCHAIAKPELQTPAAYGLVGNLDTALG